MLTPFDVLPDAKLRAAVLLLALSFILLEYLTSVDQRQTHDLGESAASFGVALGQIAVRAAEASLLAIPFALAYRYRLFDFDPFSLIAVAALFVGTEFSYYWHHRASHRVRWLWATHATHHSPTKLNLTAGIRLGWTGNLSGMFLFYLPLAAIGFPPVEIVAMLAVNLGYQFFIHVEHSPRLGWFEWVFNTPTHHRVHHASNPSCLDKNYGGVLIVFDRLFGTFAEAPSDEPLRYGLVGGAPSNNPVRIALGEWAAMLSDSWAAPTLAGKLRALFKAPGWREPDVDDRHS